MKTDKISIADLFDRPRRYLVPIFQRGYVWTRADQWEPLWNDILNQVQELRAFSPGSHRPVRKHFLGAVVLNQANVGVRHQPVSEVIDGQQRLTTLQLILAAFRDVTAGLDHEFLKAKLQHLTDNPSPWVAEDERFKIWPTNAFRDDLRKIMLAGSVDKIEQEYPRRIKRRKQVPRPPLIEAYLFFAEAVEGFLRSASADETEEIAVTSDMPVDPERAELLLDALTRHIQLVEIELEAEDDPQVIFETLNARGAPLQPSDLIRNFVFLYATRKNEDVGRLYESYWQPFDEELSYERGSKTHRFWKDEERQGRLKTSRLDLFFYHYMTFRTEHDLKIKHIFQEFRDWWEATESPRSCDVELAALRRSADLFHDFILPPPKAASPLIVLATRLKALDTTTAYPLLLLIGDSEEHLEPDDVRAMCQDIESYLVRRAICGLTPKNYNRVFLSLVRGLKSPSAQALQSELLALEGESTEWPNDEAFRRAWLTGPTYETLGSRRTQLVLEQVEHAMRSERQEEIELKSPLTVEHIMPQNGSATDWPLPPSREGEEEWETHLRRSRAIQNIGNLTLLTQWLNSSVSNGPFPAKRDALAQQSTLRLNVYFQRVAATDTWAEEEIAKRAEHLFTYALKLWPRPSS